MHCLSLYILKLLFMDRCYRYNYSRQEVTTLFKYFQLNSYGMDYIIKRWKISFLGWNQNIKKVTVIGYIVVCISRDRITPFDEFLRRNRCYIVNNIEQQKCLHAS